MDALTDEGLCRMERYPALERIPALIAVSAEGMLRALVQVGSETPGRHTVTIEPADVANWTLMNFLLLVAGAPEYVAELAMAWRDQHMEDCKTPIDEHARSLIAHIDAAIATLREKSE